MSHTSHTSLLTLEFTADDVSFVENRSPGRIVEALIEDFLALGGSGILTVVIQNTGVLTSDYSVSIRSCTDGIIQIAEKAVTILPREQKTLNFEISSHYNSDMNHSCTGKNKQV